MSVEGNPPAGLIGLDFDGTLLRSDKTVSDRTRTALRRAAEAGWLIVGATGRPPEMADEIVAVVPELTHIVCNNGTLTRHARTGEVIDQRAMSAEIATWGAQVARSVSADVGLVIDHVEGEQSWEQGFEKLVFSPPRGKPVLDAAGEISGEVRKVIAFSPSIDENDMLDRLGPLLHPRLEPTHAGLPFVEIGPPGVSKASALAHLVSLHGIDVRQTAAFGDAPNDHEMLRWAATGVAMANAFQATQELADFVTSSNDHDGVAKWIESEILLERPLH